MSYDHSKDFESGDSMNAPASGDSASPAKGKPKSTDSSAGSSPPSDAAPTTAPHRCSYCGQGFDRADSRHMPFCSKRCQQIDLGMWLNESYGMPHEGESSLDSYGVQDNDD